jgi:hypothetical protein
LFEKNLAMVTIRRGLGWYGLFRPLRVFIDGQPVTSIHRKFTEEFPLPPAWGSLDCRLPVVDPIRPIADSELLVLTIVVPMNNIPPW